MLLLATSDAPLRPDVPDAEVEPGEPEPEQPPPVFPERPEPELSPPDAPEGEPSEIAQPHTPEITPSDLAGAAPPDASALTPTAIAQPVPERIALEATEPAPPPPPEPAAERSPPLQRAALALLVIAAAALIGYALSRPADRGKGPDALARSLEAAGQLRLVLETDTPSEARQFVRDEFGWRVGVPVFEAAALRGVAIAETAPAVEVPVFLYADAEGRDVAVFSYSYALLDQVPDRLRLTDAEYEDLDGGAPFVRRTGGEDLVLWRDRDDIYVAITDLPPDALIGGLAMAR